MNILIIGNAKDAHAVHLQYALTQAGATADYLDTSLFPTQLQLSWKPENRVGYLYLPEGRRLEFAQIHSVFWRNFAGVRVPYLQDSYQQMVAENDAMSAMRSLLQACPASWVNSWQAYQFHQEKPLQLSKAKQIGVTIPPTLISNSPDEIIEFVKSQTKAIFKPVYGGTHTKLVTAEHLDLERLNLVLRLAPVTIQEYIPGTNVRSYVIGKSIYAAEIRTDRVDFRDDIAAELIPVELPQLIQQQCLDITQALMLEWTAIDWRRKPTGEYVFLEANPRPMFIYFEQQTGFPITQKLVELLTK